MVVVSGNVVVLGTVVVVTIVLRVGTVVAVVVAEKDVRLCKLNTILHNHIFKQH